MTSPDDKLFFRQVLGHYPTGVCAITATQADGIPVSMIVGSFTSVSLDPPLVAFFPDKYSSSWPKIEICGKFCVNVLAEDQETLCRTLASKDPNKFDRVARSLSSNGAPVLEGAIAWIDCSLISVQEIGDHYIAVGQVDALDVHRASAPLLFHRGKYHKIAYDPVII